MLFIYFLSLSLIFASTFLLVFAGTINLKQAKEIVSITEEELTRSLLDRVFLPAIQNLATVAKKLTPTGVSESLQHKLELAGSPRNLDVDRLLALKMICLFSGCILAIIYFAYERNLLSLYGGIIFASLCFFIPDIWLNHKIQIRQKNIVLMLPDTLDLLTISVEAGLGFDSALSKVIKNTKGPLAEEFFRMLQEIRLGTSRREAFKKLSERTNVPELQGFILAMLQADIFGISIAKVLRVQAQEMRIKRRQKAEENAMKAPVKMVFPLILCIFPALLVIVLGPAVIKIYTAFMQNL